MDDQIVSAFVIRNTRKKVNDRFTYNSRVRSIKNAELLARLVDLLDHLVDLSATDHPGAQELLEAHGLEWPYSNEGTVAYVPRPSSLSEAS